MRIALAGLCVVWGVVAGAAEGPHITIGLPDVLAPRPTEEKAGRVNLNVSTTPGLPEGAFPLSGGVPFPAGELLAPEHARVLRGEEELPAQCSVLARWPDGTIRFLLVEVIADAAARGALTLEYGQGITHPRPPAQPLKVEQTVDGVKFTSGSFMWRAVQAPGFRLFAEVALDGHPLAAAEGRCGPSAGEAEADLCAPAEFRVEEAGPLRATLLARGVHQDRAGKKHLDYVVRATVWAGLPFLKVEHTFIQTDEPIFLDARDVAVTLPLAAATQAVFGTASGEQAVALNGQPVKLLQGVGTIEKSAWKFPCTLSSGPGTLYEGDRAPGWLAMQGGNGGAAVAIKDFWQNAPKALTAEPSALVAGLVPKEGVPLDLHTGTAKTHELLYVFHAGAWAAAKGTVLAALRRFQDGPLLVCDPAWYAKTKALGEMLPARPEKHAVYEAQACAMAERAFGLQRELLGLYGMLDYGDSLYGQASDCFWNNMETAYDHGLFMLGLRTGSKRVLDQALAAARHFGDVDVRHCQPKSYDYGSLVGFGLSREEAEQLTRGLNVKTLKKTDEGTVLLPLNAPPEKQREFSSFWAGSMPDPAANDLAGTVYGHSHYHQGHNRVDKDANGKEVIAQGGSHIGGHTWLLGLLDRYLLTGDRRALEVAEEVGQHMLRHPPKQDFRRETGWPAVNLVALFNATGKREYLKLCQELLQYLVDLDAAGKDGGKSFANYTYTILQATRDYHLVTGDPGARQWYMKGIASVMTGTGVARGAKGIAGKDMAPDAEGVFTFVRHYSDERVWTTLADLAYAWRLTGDKKYLETGLANFRVTSAFTPDSVMLWSAPWLLAGLEEAGIPNEEKGPAGRPVRFALFELRFPAQERVFWVNDPEDAEFEVRVLQNTGYRKNPYPFDGTIQVFAPDGAKAAERKLDTFGLYAYVLRIPKDGKKGAYRVTISCEHKSPVFSAASDAPGMVAEIPGQADGMYTTASDVFFQAPARGPAKITVKRFLSGRGGFRLVRPGGEVFGEVCWAVQEKPDTLEIPEGDKDRGGIWKVQLAAEKNYITLEGIPPFLAAEPALYFAPRKK